MGNIVALALSGWIAFAWGWPAVFYVFGAVGVMLAVLFYLLTADSPEAHPRISQAERDYIITVSKQSELTRALKTYVHAKVGRIRFRRFVRFY